MRIFITGITGLLGTNLAHELIGQGHQITAIVRDPAKYIGNLTGNLHLVKMSLSDDYDDHLRDADIVVHIAAETATHLLRYSDRLSEKMSKARNLLLTEAIDANDYKLLKEDIETSIKKAESKLNTIGNKKVSQAHIEKLMDKAINTLSRLETHFGNLPVSRKREFLGSIFPEKIVFDGKEYRTPRLNEVVRIIYMINNDLYSIKNRKGHKSAYLSGQVESPGIEPKS